MYRLISCMLLLAFAAGCSDDPVAPELVKEDPPAPLEVPLATGNTWMHTLHRETRYYNQDRTREVLAPVIQDATSFKEIVGVETIAGKEYVAEKETFVLQDPGGDITNEYWRRYRQDETGFYQAALRLGWGFGNVPPMEFVPEIRTLGYPVDVDGTWNTNDGRTATVEAVEMVDTPGGMAEAYRVRLESTDPESLNWTLLWYGRCGLIKRHVHVGQWLQDVGENRIILLEIDTVETIEAVNVAQGGCELGAPAEPGLVAR